MKPKAHIYLGIIFTIFLFLLFPKTRFFELSVIFLSSVLMDIDHYLYYVIRKKDFSLKRAYIWFLEINKKHDALPIKERLKTYKAVCWLHGLECLIILIILSYFFHIFFLILIGFVFHYSSDEIEGSFYNGENHGFSSIYKFIKTKNLKHIENVNYR